VIASVVRAGLTAAVLLRPVQQRPDSGDAARPIVRIAFTTAVIRIDGRLSEPAWSTADSVTNLTQVEPTEGAVPSARTVVRVLTSGDAILIGVRADDPEPSRIVSYVRQRDATLDNEDHVAILLDTYRDGRSGYVFAVNPNGARYDALVSSQGEGLNANWDAVWEAAAARTAAGWELEIRIPLKSLLFRPAFETWGFNVQRRIQRFQETDRWARRGITTSRNRAGQDFWSASPGSISALDSASVRRSRVDLRATVPPRPFGTRVTRAST